MKCFITGEFGRPTAIEANSFRYSPGHEIMHYPNVDELDPFTMHPRDPVGTVRNSCESLAALYEQQRQAIDRFGPDMLITCFLDDASVADMSTQYSGRLPTFCVSREASKLEGDRQYARDVCAVAGVATTKLLCFDSSVAAIRSIVAGRIGVHGAVIKFAGARANNPDGIGNIWAQVARSSEDAIEAVRQWPDHAYPIAVEDLARGVEVAFSALVDAELDLIIPMVTDFEYTRLCAGDIGPETSEMGCHDVVGVPAQIVSEVFERLMPWFKSVGYRGWFDVSGIWTEHDRKFVAFEFMTRLGSSQTDCVCAMLGMSFVDLIHRFLQGQLSVNDVTWRHKHAVAVVAATPGHPIGSAGWTPAVVTGPVHELVRVREVPGALWQMSRQEARFDRDGRMLVNGQVVYFGIGASSSFDRAKGNAYQVVDSCRFPGMVYRNDVGHRWERSRIQQWLES